MYTILIIVGYILLGLSTIVGVGDAIYTWYVTDLLRTALWNGFVTFFWMFVSGIICIVAGLIGVSIEAGASQMRRWK